MPEAEDVIIDAARHATVFARDLWRRHEAAPRDEDSSRELAQFAQRLELLLSAVFGRSFRLRIAQTRARPTLLQKVFARHTFPQSLSAIPATDGDSIWLARSGQNFERMRCIALQQGMRAFRGSAQHVAALPDDCTRSIYLLLEAHAADAQLMKLLPGIARALREHRSRALSERPALHAFPVVRRPLESFTREVMQDLSAWSTQISQLTSADQTVLLARKIASELAIEHPGQCGSLFLDAWTGELIEPGDRSSVSVPPSAQAPSPVQRSARLRRQPRVRKRREGEDDSRQSAWMIQTSQPHEHAEDPLGMQRPTDRDEKAAAEEFADSVAELAEARLVATPGRAKEVLLADDAPDSTARALAPPRGNAQHTLAYPEWDFRSQSYRPAGALVHLVDPPLGDLAWVKRTLDEHATLIYQICRRFDALHARNITLKKQDDGDDIDLDAYIDAYADWRAGRPMPPGLYQTQRAAKRDAAILLLIDVSGSTDGWVDAHRRVIDVEREALLLVCLALQGMGDPFAVLGYSGESAQRVTVKTLKEFHTPYDERVAQRIAGLEPEHYTRTGAALRHATAQLMRMPAQHRLLMLLSDGKPNDVDEYEGTYGVEDVRQAVIEAKLQGVHPFCLTIDRQAAAYLPRIFGAAHYALLPRPEHLPLVLLEWLRRLVVR